MVNRLLSVIVYSTVGKHNASTEAISERQIRSSKSSFSGIRRLVRQHIILPAVFGYRHSVPWGWCTIPTRLQTFIVFAYVVLNIILCSIRYTSFDDNIL